MPSCPQCTLPSPPALPWTVDEAQKALADVVYQLLALVDTLEAVHAGLPEPPDIADRQEARKPYDRATDILGTIECVIEDNLRPAIEILQRSAEITDAELAAEHRELLARRREP